MIHQPIFEPRFIAMAEVLGELGAEIEALGEVFCRDETFVARHLRELQAIDLIAQKQRALAAILAAGFSEVEMRRINLETLHERFCGFMDGTAETCCEVPIEDTAGCDPLGLWE
ncbi:hypothetical protein ACLIMP_14290 [Novosphingobium aerophilum]|uniref:hypothetical protein n=1 Tax=Novosphingobium TaxID=165696 RepID=UPI0006C8D528|nr:MULTISPECIES: hypothetical protein [unclassified Novosphingobium]KPH64796.1 hypothetical protein ADT71_10920 [Novosphingobium sp. ST904]TCM34531.1 hypothetical protein EDF59_11791 [Novosphingobium sp. ST904]WRT92422.1 hypothetical protein U9J33_14615 [Novosphingobium sp. RL4]